jgi:hypothetical protein
MKSLTAGPRGRRPGDALALLARARPASLDRGPIDLARAHEVAARLAAAADGLAAGTAAGPPAASGPAASPAGQHLAPRSPSARPHRPPVRGHRPHRRMALAGAGLAVAGGAVAAAVLAATGNSPVPPPRPAVLTAAMVRQLATASRLALADSGRAVISYRVAQDGVLQQTGSDDITFSGKNWNDSFSQAFPAPGNGAGHVQRAVNRVVNGQFYLYIIGRNGHLQWVHDTNPSGHPVVTAPDSRKLLAVLKPAAGFRFTGYRMFGGVRLKGLRATHPHSLPRLSSLFSTLPGGHTTSLTVWVDGHGVVHRMSATILETLRTWAVNPHLGKAAQQRVRRREALKLTKKDLLSRRPMTRYLKVQDQLRRSRALVARTHEQVSWVSVVFSSIGQPQHITVPQHAVSQYGRG